MHKRQINKLNSYKALQGIFSRERVNFSSLPDFVARETAFNSAVAQIESLTPQQQYANVAEMVTFTTEKERLAEKVSIVSKKLVIYAEHVANSALIADVNYSYYALKRMKTTSMIDIAKVVVERANKVLPDAEISQLTKDKIDDISDSLTVIEKTRVAYRNFQLKMRRDTLTIADAFAKADAALARISLSVALMAHIQPTLYKQYQEACRIINSARTFSLKGSVAEAKTEYPIQNVKLLIRKIEDSAPSDLMITPPELVKQSAEKGGFIVRNLTEGFYLLTATKLGYQTTNVQFMVSPTETAVVNILMEAV